MSWGDILRFSVLTRSMLRIAMVGACALCAVISGPIFAQNAPQQFQQAFGNLLGAVIQQAQVVEDAKRSWKQVDPRVQVCLLRTYNLSPRQLSQNGIRADDPRLTQHIQLCQRIVWRQQQDGARSQSGVPEKADHGWFGVVTVDLTNEVANAYGFSAPTGVLVVEVRPGSPAARAGIKPGDIILRLNGSIVEDRVSFDAILLWMREGQNAPVAVMHDRNTERVQASLAWANGAAYTRESGTPQPPQGSAPPNTEPPPVARSWYVVRARSSEAGGGGSDTLLAAARKKVEALCAGDYSIMEHHTYDGSGRDASASGVHEPWLDATVACAAERPVVSEAATAALTIDDLIQSPRSDGAKTIPGAQYFDVFSGKLDCPYDAALRSVGIALKSRGDHVALLDKDKGLVVTAYPPNWNTERVEQFFIVLDPESDTQTRMTFKLISHWRHIAASDKAEYHLDDHETVVRMAAQFVSAVRQSLTH